MNTMGLGTPGNEQGPTNKQIRSGTDQKLKPCPFCKCPVTLFVSIYGVHGANDYYALAHPDGTDCIIDGMVTSSYSDKEELIHDWNRRMSE